jgi:hypothetical protein
MGIWAKKREGNPATHFEKPDSPAFFWVAMVISG